MKEFEGVILKKIKNYAEQALEFKAEMDFSDFSADAKTVAACGLNLSQIGELAGRLSEAFMNDNPQIPCRKMRGMRNRIVHDYEGIQLNIVWDVLEKFLPELIENIEKMESDAHV